MTTCPKCGAEATTSAKYTSFWCGSVLWSDGSFEQSSLCVGYMKGRRQAHLEACSELRALMERTHEPARYWAGRLRRRLARLRRSK